MNNCGQEAHVITSGVALTRAIQNGQNKIAWLMKMANIALGNRLSGWSGKSPSVHFRRQFITIWNFTWIILYKKVIFEIGYKSMQGMSIIFSDILCGNELISVVIEWRIHLVAKWWRIMCMVRLQRFWVLYEWWAALGLIFSDEWLRGRVWWR